MSDKSASVRNYAIAALCLAGIVGVFSFAALNYSQIQEHERYDDRPEIHAYARCEVEKWATVSIESHRTGIQNVQCISLNDGLFKESTIVLGDLGKGSQDVCYFEAVEKIDVPPRFEIKYDNGKTLRTSCDRGWVLD